MIQQLQKKEQVVMDPIHYLPSVSMAFSFDPRSASRSSLEQKLGTALLRVEKEWAGTFPRSVVRPALVRLKKMLGGLNYQTNNKSVVLSLSPFSEKITYLNMQVPERIVTGGSLRFRDLVRSVKAAPAYLLLVPGEKRSRLFLGRHDELSLLTENRRLWSGKKDAATRKEEALQFLERTDQHLSLMLRAYDLPLFVAACPKVSELFLSRTANKESILEVLTVRSEETSEKGLQHLMAPLLNRWNSLAEKEALGRLTRHAAAGKAWFGIREVWQAARERKTRLLFVEEGYEYFGYFDEEDRLLSSDAIPMSSLAVLKDVVDDVLENVLSGGGSAVLVPKGSLGDSFGIALF